MAPRQACPEDVLQWIPWYPDEGLSERQRGAVEAHAADCPRCREEIGLVLGTSQGTGEVPDAEGTLASLWKRIEASSPEPEAAPAPTRRPMAPAARAPRRPRPVGRGGVPAVVAAAALLLVAGAGVVAGLVLSQPGEPVFRTAAEAGAPARAADGPLLEVVFANDAPASRIREALRTLDAQIVAGPTALGRFRVQLPAGADAAAAAERLRSEESDVALFAQPSGP